MFSIVSNSQRVHLAPQIYLFAHARFSLHQSQLGLNFEATDVCSLILDRKSFVSFMK